MSGGDESSSWLVVPPESFGSRRSADKSRREATKYQNIFLYRHGSREIKRSTPTTQLNYAIFRRTPLFTCLDPLRFLYPPSRKSRISPPTLEPDGGRRKKPSPLAREKQFLHSTLAVGSSPPRFSLFSLGQVMTTRGC